MRNPFADDMFRATRLTQVGRLEEATALLQKLLRGGAQLDTSQADGSAKRSDIALPPLTIDAVADCESALDVGTTPTKDSSDQNPATTSDPEPKLSKRFLSVFQTLQLNSSVQALRGGPKAAPPASEVTPSVGRFIATSFSNEAGSRAYKLYIPSRHDNEPRPLLVMLHGCTQSPDDFAAGTRMNFAAEEHGAFVVYPEQTAAANASKCWNWFNSGDQKRGLGEPALIAGITRQVMADYNINPRCVYIAGLSAGGAAAAIVAEAYPDIYAAAGVHSGLPCGVARDLPSAFAAMQGRRTAPDPKSGRRRAKIMPMIVFHGDRDSTVHPSNGVELITRAQAGGEFQTVMEKGSMAGKHAYTRSIQRDANGHGIIEQWVIHGAGHAWSGGSPSGSFTDSKGPDATREMLRFFLEHVRESAEAKGS